MDLRCHSCSHAIGIAVDPLKLVAIFKPSAAGRLSKAHDEEIRKRCRHCGWVNVFHPERVIAIRTIEFKKSVQESVQDVSGCAV